MFRIASGIFHGCVLVFAIAMIVWPITVVIAQSSRLEYQVETLERQIENIPSAMQTLDRRLTIIETILRDVEGGSIWGQMTMGGVGLLLLKELATVLKRKDTNQQ